MILEIDAGNTSLKWRWRGAATATSRDLATLETALPPGARPGEVLVGNVRGPEFEAELRQWCLQRWNLRPRFARVTRDCGGVRIQYPEPAQLGVDRWLAMLAAYRRAGRACLVADSGTALTLDLIAADGLHLGGYIMPGLAALRAGLAQATGLRPPLDGGAESTALGNDTAAALRNGTLFMLCGAVWMAARGPRPDGGGLSNEHPRQDRETPALLLTGGDAALLRRELREEAAELVPDLVLDGLAIASEEAED